MERATHNIIGVVAGLTTHPNTAMATPRGTASIHQATAITDTGVVIEATLVDTAADTVVGTAADTVTAHIADVEEADITDIPLCTLTSGRFISASVGRRVRRLRTLLTCVLNLLGRSFERPILARSNQ